MHVLQEVWKVLWKNPGLDTLRNQQNHLRASSDRRRRREVRLQGRVSGQCRLDSGLRGKSEFRSNVTVVTLSSTTLALTFTPLCVLKQFAGKKLAVYEFEPMHQLVW